MSSEYYCVPRWVYLIHKFELLVPDERYLIDLFVLKVCIMISLLGYNLVINDRKMHFTFLCNEPLSIQNVKPTYFC